MDIIVKAEKVISPNGKAWKITEVQAESRETLPDAYLSGAVYCYQQGEDEIWILNAPNAKVGRTYSEKKFGQLMAELKRCGENLHRIRSVIREETKNWSGEVIFVI
jgi:hypothetical protein